MHMVGKRKDTLVPVQISVPYVRVGNRLGPKAANTLAGVGLTRSDAVRIP